MTGASALFLVVIAGFLLLGVVIEWFEERSARHELDRYEHESHDRLMRELGRHR